MTRATLQDHTRYFIDEARRAIGYAAQSYVMRERSQYVEWMNNATELLMAAAMSREDALKTPWHK